MREQIVTALTQHPYVLEAYLFGSQARGEARRMSDVDVAVYLDPELTPDKPFGIAAELAADLIGALGRNDVDLVILNDAPPLLYHRVLRDGERLLSRDLARTTTREGQALSRYLDWKPQLEKFERAQQLRIARGEFGK
jgi:predicted nucleotidyltransferase